MFIFVRLVEQIEEFDGRDANARARTGPLEQPRIGSDRRLRLRRGGTQLDHRLAPAGDDDFFTGERPVDQLGKLVLGLGNAVVGHRAPRLMAINMAISFQLSTAAPETTRLYRLPDERGASRCAC